MASTKDLNIGDTFLVGNKEFKVIEKTITDGVLVVRSGEVVV